MEKLRNTVGFIHFVIVLDNNGKRIYSRYFNAGSHYLADHHQQKEFEKKIGQTVLNLNVNRNNEGKKFEIEIN